VAPSIKALQEAGILEDNLSQRPRREILFIFHPQPFDIVHFLLLGVSQFPVNYAIS
jgi:hypothetical protein